MQGPLQAFSTAHPSDLFTPLSPKQLQIAKTLESKAKRQQLKINHVSTAESRVQKAGAGWSRCVYENAEASNFGPPGPNGDA